MKIDEIMNLLKQTYWAERRSQETVEKSMRNSQCYGIYHFSAEDPDLYRLGMNAGYYHTRSPFP